MYHNNFQCCLKVQGLKENSMRFMECKQNAMGHKPQDFYQEFLPQTSCYLALEHISDKLK